MSYNKCLTLLWDVVNGEGSTYVGGGNIWESFVSSQFFCEPKAALKIVFKKKDLHYSYNPIKYVFLIEVFLLFFF